MRTVRISLILALAALPVPFALAAPDGGTQGPGAHHHAGSGLSKADTAKRLAAVRRATARFRDVSEARRAGYVPPPNCVAEAAGGMGFHYTHPALAADRKLRIRTPEVLLYEKRNGRLHLTGVEYFRADADQRLDTNDDLPRLFGRDFDGPMEGHEPGMPVHYDLHAWVWKKNPSGTFAQFNPRVRC
jgi:hypothetical protein